MIYFDHAAGTPVRPEIRNAYGQYLVEFSGNPEAAHAQGYALRKKRRELDARLFRALGIGCPDINKCVFYAANATTLINACGSLHGSPDAIAWGSMLDHAACREVLARNFKRVEFFRLADNGQICACPENPAPAQLIVISAVQSECGCCQDWAKWVKILRKIQPQAVILLDAVQSLDAVMNQLQRDCMPDWLLISGSKIGGGNTAALAALGARAEEFRCKFEQLRKAHLIGRSDPVAAAALVQAVELNCSETENNVRKLHELNSFLRGKLTDMTLPNGKKLILTVPGEYASDRILHFILPGYQAGVLVRMFSAENIMLASGSACESESGEPSRFLRALGYSKNDAYSGLRLSFAPENTLEEAAVFLQTLTKILKNY